ncbi:integrase core domain-containing protein [Streptomyces monticola]|uniref:Integrase core domain-containing protein n=1 Tax=Streptomyces monticola TaxID=2666263 RepID=A0ABW2JRS2_9ACTN
MSDFDDRQQGGGARRRHLAWGGSGGSGDLGEPVEERIEAGLVHHSDHGVQYRAIRYTERLEEAAAVASVGSRGDSYDNALAEAFNSLFKAELIRNRGSWTGINDVEIAVTEYIDWFNQRRLHRELGHLPPAEVEAHHATTGASLTP